MPSAAMLSVKVLWDHNLQDIQELSLVGLDRVGILSHLQQQQWAVMDVLDSVLEALALRWVVDGLVEVEWGLEEADWEEVSLVTLDFSAAVCKSSITRSSRPKYLLTFGIEAVVVHLDSLACWGLVNVGDVALVVVWEV